MKKVMIKRESIEITCPACQGTGKIFTDNRRMIFGEKVRIMREKAGLRQEDLARKMNLSRTSITNIETGKQNIPVFKIYEIADILNVEAKDLL